MDNGEWSVTRDLTRIQLQLFVDSWDMVLHRLLWEIPGLLWLLCATCERDLVFLCVLRTLSPVI